MKNLLLAVLAIALADAQFGGFYGGRPLPLGPVPWRYPGWRWAQPGWGGYRRRPLFGMSIGKPGFGFDIGVGRRNGYIANYPAYPMPYRMPLPIGIKPTTEEAKTEKDTTQESKTPKVEKYQKFEGEEIVEQVKGEDNREKRDAGLLVPHFGRKTNRLNHRGGLNCPPGTKNAFGWECISTATRYPHNYDIYW